MINKRKSCCILLVAYIVVLVTTQGHTNIKINITPALSSVWKTFMYSMLWSFQYTTF